MLHAFLEKPGDTESPWRPVSCCPCIVFQQSSGLMGCWKTLCGGQEEDSTEIKIKETNGKKYTTSTLAVNGCIRLDSDIRVRRCQLVNSIDTNAIE